MADIMTLDRARALADRLRAIDPEQAEKIDAAIANCITSHAETLKLSVSIGFRLEKFKGPIVPGAMPFDTIEGRDNVRDNV